MDIGSVSSDTAVGASGLVASFGVLLKSIYDRWCAREDRKEIDARFDAIENGAVKATSDATASLAATTQTIEKRLDLQDAEIASHALMDAQTFVTKAEYGSLKDHMDKQFGELRGLIIDVIKTNPGRRRR